MLMFTLKRTVLAVLVAITVSAITFSLAHLSGDPATAMAGPNATSQDIDAIRKLYGFDRPLPVQFFEWFGSALRGDFGMSFYYRVPVADLLRDRLPVSMTLGVSAIVFAVVLGVPLGVVAAIRPNSWIDKTALTISVFGQALPSFWFALTLIIVLGVWMGVLPISGTESWDSFVMPTIVLGYYAMPAIMRLTRAGMLEVLASDYIRTARAKGLRPMKVLFKHALRNAIIPVVSLAAVQFGFMLGGSIVIESIFALHGAGFLAWESINGNDLPTLQAIILVFALFYVVLTYLADLLNAWLDPRLRVG